MNMLMSFVNPLEFILRYSVLTGMALCIIGTAVCLLARRITMAIRKRADVSKSDKVYTSFLLVGVGLILIGMIVIALPIEATFYVI